MDVQASVNSMKRVLVNRLFKAIALALSVSTFPLANQPTTKPDANKPISVTGGVSGQITWLIDPQARADLFSGVILDNVAILWSSSERTALPAGS